MGRLLPSGAKRECVLQVLSLACDGCLFPMTPHHLPGMHVSVSPLSLLIKKPILINLV